MKFLGGQSTIHSDTFLIGELWHLLTDRLPFRGGLAIIVEGVTDYGRHLLGDPKDSQDRVYISYPREISRLRNVYPEETAPASAQVQSLQRQLFLSLRDPHSGKDTAPQFSEQTPLSQEAVLLQIAETLRRERIGVALITGTDILDVLFLCRELRQLSPDVRLVVNDADLLMVHGVDTLDFTGTLVLTTNPLIPENRRWTRNDKRVYFASNTMEGVYNALRLLLNTKVSANELSEYVSPQRTESRVPPAWLTIVGRDGYWPVALLSDLDAHTPVRSAGPTRPAAAAPGLDPGKATRSWNFAFYSCTLLTVLYAALCIWVPRQQGPLARWCSVLHPCPSGYLGTWRPHYSSLLSLGILLAYLAVFLAPLGLTLFQVSLALQKFHGRPESLFNSLRGLSPWALFVAIGSLAVCVLLVALLQAISRTGIPWRVTLLLLGVSAITVMASLFCGRDPETFFRAFRSVQIGSGVAPNLPPLFVFLALGWWASVQVQRFVLVKEHRQTLPVIPGERADANETLIESWVEQPFLHIDHLGAWFPVAVGALVFAMAYWTAGSIERLRFDMTLGVLFAMLIPLMFLTTYSFLRIWRALHRTLADLDLRPIRFAFSDLPAAFSWSPLWHGGSRNKSYLILIRTISSLRALHRVKPNYYAALAADTNSLETSAQAILIRVSGGLEEEIGDVESCRDKLSEISGNLAAVLDANGWRTSESETLGRLEEKHGKGTRQRGRIRWFGAWSSVRLRTSPAALDPGEKADTLAAEIVALRYLHYIRYIMRHLSNLLSFVTTGFILIVLALNCYPFQAENIIRWSTTLVFVLLGAVIVGVFMQMSRDPILSRITDTTPGSVDTSFYTRVIAAGALPLLAVLGSHFPSVGRFLFSWVQPALAALH